MFGLLRLNDLGFELESSSFAFYWCSESLFIY